MKSFKIFLPLLVSCLLLSCSSNPERKGITVFCAASLTPVMEQIKEDWEHKHAEKIIINSASTGTLARQISFGAEADIFISANQQWISYLSKDSVLAGSPTVVATNRLAIVAKDKELPKKEFAEGVALIMEHGGKVSIANPEHVPLGMYSMQTLIHFEAEQRLQSRVVLGKDARSTLRIVEMGEAAFGLVYLSDALSTTKVALVAIAPDSLHEKITYQGVLINSYSEKSAQFLTYLSAEETQRFWQSNGFNQ
jgi:molybdate transport system substrate-binding protein